MLSLIVNNYFTSFEEISALRKGFKLALHNASYIDAILEINNFLKRIPYDDHVVAERKGLGQWFFRPPILGLLYGAGMLVMAEVHTNKGRSDIVFQYEKHSYVIELKVADGPEKAKKELAIAMEQIRKGKYTGIFANPIPMGLVIDANERLITHVCIKTDVYLINDEKGEVRPMGTLSDLKSAIG
jgi:hypothetical protein